MNKEAVTESQVTTGWRYLHTMLCTRNFARANERTLNESVYARDVSLNTSAGMVCEIGARVDETGVTSIQATVKNNADHKTIYCYAFKDGKPDTCAWIKLNKQNEAVERFYSTSWVQMPLCPFTEEMVADFKELDGMEKYSCLNFPTGVKVTGVAEAFSKVLAGK